MKPNAKKNLYTMKLVEIIRAELKKGAKDLMTREVGQRVCERLEREITALEPRMTVALDFAGVGVIDYSCADEVIAKIISRLKLNEYGDKYIVLDHLTPTQKENIHVALERKNLAAIEVSGQSWHMLGAIHNYLLQTLNLLMEKGTLSSSELVSRLRLELTTASTRLSNLHKLRLVKKAPANQAKRGRRFIYTSIFS